MLETINYPYIPGHYGIPLSKLPEKPSTIVAGGILSGSGRTLEYVISKDRLGIRDIKNPKFHLFAKVEDSALSLDLRTKDKTFWGGTFRHPDLFASSFVGYAIIHFEKNGVTPTHFIGSWQESSDNYNLFVAEYRKSFDTVQAARATWSAKVLGRYRFLYISEEDITIKSNDEYALIQAIIRR